MSAEHGVYVELLPKGKIKRDLAGVSGEVSLEGTTVSDEVILFSELSFGPYAVVVDLIRFQAKAILKHDDHGGLGRAIGGGDGDDAVHGAGHAAVDGCADETARRAHNGTHQHRIALFHRGGARRADMLLHGQHDLFGQGHGDSGHTGCFLFMRHARAEGAAFEFG